MQLSEMKDAKRIFANEGMVRYQNLTPDGIPRFGIVYTIHETPRM